MNNTFKFIYLDWEQFMMVHLHLHTLEVLEHVVADGKMDTSWVIWGTQRKVSDGLLALPNSSIIFWSMLMKLQNFYHSLFIARDKLLKTELLNIAIVTVLNFNHIEHVLGNIWNMQPVSTFQVTDWLKSRELANFRSLIG